MLRNYEVEIMANIIVKFRGVWVIAGGLLFNLVSSLLVWHPEGVVFNKSPMTVAEWICDIINTVIIFLGFAIILYDVNTDYKRKIKEALLESKEEMNGKGDSNKN